MSDIKYWIALSMVPEVGPVRARKLLAVFKEPERVFGANSEELLVKAGMNSSVAKNIRDFSLWDKAERHAGELELKGIKAVCLQDALYPEMLRETADAPVVLYIIGDIQPDDRFAVAVVGSRKMTHYGASVAEQISGDLASMGFTIVSGLARGIDSQAHKGALGSGGRTIAVLGSGVDLPYPPENSVLMQKISESGCAMSEFLPGTTPERENFPRRNRLISGLSLGVLIIEAASGSGAMITARYAAEYGREVFAVPGSIYSNNSQGTHRLIKEGAVLVRNAEDIVDELAPVLKGFLKLKDKAEVAVNGDEKILCNLLTREPKQIDMISRESGWPASRVLGVLLGLELKGAVKQITGKRFYLA